jgi:hypothetical protein
LETTARASRALGYHESESAEKISDPALRAPVKRRVRSRWSWHRGSQQRDGGELAKADAEGERRRDEGDEAKRQRRDVTAVIW